MRWLFVTGISLDFAGAILIAWTIYQRTAAETREEALTKYGANLWVVVFRLREQAFVRAGVALLATGFLLQWVGYVSRMGAAEIVSAAFISAALVSVSLLVAHRLASRAVPVSYTDSDDLPDGIRDERHAYNLGSSLDVKWFRQNYAERVSRVQVTPRNVVVEPSINHGTWLFSCPDCGPAHVATATPELDTVVCSSCGGEFPAVYPADRMEIERLLLARPYAENRNWKPGETVEALRNENSAQGIEAAL